MSRLTFFAALAWTLGFAATARAADIQGTLKERGTRKPLAGVNVFLLEDASESAPNAPNRSLKATTDDQGRFSFNGVAEDRFFELIVNLPGYLKLEKYDQQAKDAPNPPRELFLEKNRYQLYETTVVGKEETRDDAQTTLGRADFINLPGSGSGDPLKGVQNLPGVNRAAPFSSHVIIQGSAPEDTIYTIDGHEVPIIFHFGGFSSVVFPEALDRVDYLSAGYGPEFGRAIGGLVGVWTRDPRVDRVHGFAFVDLLNAGALVEGPIGEGTEDGGHPKSSFMLGARQSYIGPILKAAFKNNSDFNLTVAPSFGDLIGIYEAEVTPIDHFKLVISGSRDSLEFILPEPIDEDPSFRGNFSTETDFFRIIPEWTHVNGPNTTTKVSLGFGRDFVRFDTDQDYFNAKTYQLTPRAEVDHRFNQLWQSQFGFDSRLTWADVNVLSNDVFAEGGVFNPFSTGSVRQQNVSQGYHAYGGYWRNEIHPGADSPWTILPGIREEYYDQTGQALTLPRLGLRYKQSEMLTYRVAGGLYAEPPQPQETDAVFGNPDLKAPRAWHVAVGADVDLRQGSSRGVTVSPGVFYKHFDDLVEPSTATVTRNGLLAPENFDNSGHGKAYGLEALAKLYLAPWTGWLSYTLSRSTRTTATEPEYPFAYDQTHVLTAIAAVELNHHWTLSGRFRYATGDPYTPIDGSVFDADNDVYIPIRGPLYSQRLDAFYQLDFRADKRWIYNHWILSLYLDIQNITNRKNIEALQYSYNYQQSTAVSGLPIIPTLGVKAEF